MGLGAQSFSQSTLQYGLGSVTKRLGQYLRSVSLDRLPIQDLYHLSRPVAMGKFCSVSFYFGGIDLAAFEELFGASLEAMYPEAVAFVLRHKLMAYDHGRLQLTTTGKQHYAGTIAQFYSPAVQTHLLTRTGGEHPTTAVHPELYQAVRAEAEADSAWQPPVLETAPAPQPKASAKKQPSPSATPARSWSATRPAMAAAPPRRQLHTRAAEEAHTGEEAHTDNEYMFGNILFGGPCNQV